MFALMRSMGLMCRDIMPEPFYQNKGLHKVGSILVMPMVGGALHYIV
jgi:hypothetical protein